MNLLRKVATAGLTLSLIATPVLSSAASQVRPATRSIDRDGDAAALGAGEQGTSAETWVLALLAASAAIAGIVKAAQSGNDTPTSP